MGFWEKVSKAFANMNCSHDYVVAEVAMLQDGSGSVTERCACCSHERTSFLGNVRHIHRGHRLHIGP